MAGALSISVLDNCTPEVRHVVESIRNGDLHRGIGRAVQNDVRKHLIAYNASHPNDLGGARTNFYAKAAEKTTFATTPDSVIVSIDKQGFRQRFEGGTINAPGDGWLTIPARSEAHGHRAREFNDLRFIKFASGAAALVQADQTSVKRGKKGPSGRAPFRSGGEVGGFVMYWLVHSVTQRGDRGVLPTEQELIDSAIRGATAVYELVTERRRSA